jgi:hypothetical protein
VCKILTCLTGTGIAYLSGAPEFTPDFQWGCITRSIVLYVCYVDRYLSYGEFEDTKGVIRIRISKKNRHHNGKEKKYKRTNNDLHNIHIKLLIE